MTSRTEEISSAICASLDTLVLGSVASASCDRSAMTSVDQITSYFELGGRQVTTVLEGLKSFGLVHQRDSDVDLVN